MSKVKFKQPTRAHGVWPVTMTGLLVRPIAADPPVYPAKVGAAPRPVVGLFAMRKDGQESTCWMTIPVEDLAAVVEALHAAAAIAEAEALQQKEQDGNAASADGGHASPDAPAGDGEAEGTALPAAAHPAPGA